LLDATTIGIDATTLEANAAMRSIVRRDTGVSYDAYLTKLAQSAGIPEPTREQLARFDRKRKKKGSNREWKSPADPDARITKMKDGRTHLAHKVEHAVDLSSGALLAITVQAADLGDTTTVCATLAAAGDAAAAAGLGAIENAVLDKGYHSDDTLVLLEDVKIRSYIPEPKRKRRRWKKGKATTRKQQALYANRRRIHGARNKGLQAKRAEFNERSNAHMYETGGMRRVYLRGQENSLKRLLIHGTGFNLGLVMRARFRVGTPRGLQDRSLASFLLQRVTPCLAKALCTAISDFYSIIQCFLRPRLTVFHAWCQAR
jgi:transposase